jgi:hypothetical protein
MIATNKDLTRAQRQRGFTLGLLRALGFSAVLIALYYLAPLWISGREYRCCCP